MKETFTQQRKVDVDVLIVGGGPVGLSLAVGLLQRGVQTLVVERGDPPVSSLRGVSVNPTKPIPNGESFPDWTKSFTYAIDSRGRGLMEKLGVLSELEGLSRGFGKMHFIFPDGRKKTMVIGGAQRGGGGRISSSIKLQRSQLLQVLHARYLRDSSRSKKTGQILHGSVVEDISFPSKGIALVSVRTVDGTNTTTTISCRRLVGCDGIGSRVRQVLESKMSLRSFRTRSIRCPSAGLVFRSLMVRNEPSTRRQTQIESPPSPSSSSPTSNNELHDNDDSDVVSLQDFVSYHGTRGHSASMLGFHETVKDDEGYVLRPLSMARRSDYFLYQCKTVEDLYSSLDREFPQLNARQRLSKDAAEQFLRSEGVTFPKPTWASRAGCLVHGVPVAIIGDALHVFGPDIGQGLNAGFLDVERLLDLLLDEEEEEEYKKKETEITDDDFSCRLSSQFEAFSADRVREAESICRILPIGNPYDQYNLRGLGYRLQKAKFRWGVAVRTGFHKAFAKKPLSFLPVTIHPPVLQAILEQRPPLPYSTILHRYQQDTAVILSTISLVLCVAVAFLHHLAPFVRTRGVR